jgi:hypothetical protein
VIIHLHTYCIEQNHSGCAYCAFQKLKPARNTAQEHDYLRVIMPYLENITNEISNQLDIINPNNENILLTNIPTKNLRPLGTIMDRINNSNDSITLVESLLVKNCDISFGQQGNNLTLDQKRGIIQVDEEKVQAINLDNFSHFVFLDDVYDSGNSFLVAKEKLTELGIAVDKISLITVLKI